MTSDVKLDKFGQFLMSNLRDASIDFFDKLMIGYWKANVLQDIQNEIKQLTADQKNLLRKCVAATMDTAIHDFLIALEENNVTTKDIQIKIDGEDIVLESKSLHKELNGKDGWFAKFSRYKIDF